MHRHLLGCLGRVRPPWNLAISKGESLMYLAANFRVIVFDAPYHEGSDG